MALRNKLLAMLLTGMLVFAINTPTADASIGGNTLQQCRDWFRGFGGAYHRGDQGTCIRLMQNWMNTTRYLRILAHDYVSPQWTHLTVDGIWGYYTEQANNQYQFHYPSADPPGVMGFYTFNLAAYNCGNFANISGTRPPACRTPPVVP